MSGMCTHCACHAGSGMLARLVWLLMQMLVVVVVVVSVIHVVLVSSRSESAPLPPRSDDHDLQAVRFMHMSIINVQGSAAMMRNSSAPVSQFQFQATLREVAAANKI
jgi:hypothetical protein